MPQPDSDDEFPDDIGHLDLSNVPGLQELPATSLVRTFDDPAVPHSLFQSSVPSEYDCDDEIDESFLAACDALEAQFALNRNRLQGGSAAQQATPTQAVTTSLHTVPSTDVRKRGLPSAESSPASKKGRITAEDKLNTVLGGFEAEINCPICFDVLVAAHLYNPCGHSCCGECAQGWVSQNKMYPTCAVCRTALSTTKPLIPNYTLDGMARQYVHALTISGRSEWQEKGERFAEWNKRHEKWRRLVAISISQARAKKDIRRGVLRLPLAGPYMPSAFEGYPIDDDDDEEEDPTYEQDEPVEVLTRRVRLSRQRIIVS